MKEPLLHYTSTTTASSSSSTKGFCKLPLPCGSYALLGSPYLGRPLSIPSFSFISVRLGLPLYVRNAAASRAPRTL